MTPAANEPTTPSPFRRSKVQWRVLLLDSLLVYHANDIPPFFPPRPPPPRRRLPPPVDRHHVAAPELVGGPDQGVFTGNKESPSPSQPQASAESFTLLRFADEMKNVRRLGKFKQYIVGRRSEATFADAIEKQVAIIKVLGSFDASGDNLQTSQKQETAKLCNCTFADVENAFAKFTGAKHAHKKVEKLKEEGKPMPKSLAVVQKPMGATPLDLARSNLAKSG